MRRGNFAGNYTNPCLTMHQPWASLLVHGIKRVEGRSWPSPIRGRLWIHAAGKVPEDDTIKAMEDFYRAIYAVNGINDIKFPDSYPVSRLVGCVDVVGCLRRDELANWEMVPEGVRLEALTDMCWLCEEPKKLLVPFEMRGNQGVYNLERKIHEAAIRGIRSVGGPLPVSFPLPIPRDLFSLKPGSISEKYVVSKTSHVEESPDLSAAIAGARAAATQYSRPDSRRIEQPTKKFIQDTKIQFGNLPREVESPSLSASSIVGEHATTTQYSRPNSINQSNENSVEDKNIHFGRFPQESPGVRASIVGKRVPATQYSRPYSKRVNQSTQISVEDNKILFGSLPQLEESPGLSASIVGKRATTTQYSRPDSTRLHQSSETSTEDIHFGSIPLLNGCMDFNASIVGAQVTATQISRPNSRRINQSTEKSIEDSKTVFDRFDERYNGGSSLSLEKEQKPQFEHTHSAPSSKEKFVEYTRLPSGTNTERVSLSHDNLQKGHFEHRRNHNRDSPNQLTPNSKLLTTALKGIGLS